MDKYSSTTEIAKELRKELKNKFKDCKFSIRSSRGEIDVSLMEAPFNPVVNGDTFCSIGSLRNNKKLTEKGLEVFKAVDDFLNLYHYDNSRAEIDYFDTNFYKWYFIGNNIKDFKLKEDISKTTNAVFRKSRLIVTPYNDELSIQSNPKETAWINKEDIPFLIEALNKISEN